jgi:hypothetical protein
VDPGAEDKVAAQPVGVGPLPKAEVEVEVEAWMADRVVLGSSVVGPSVSCLMREVEVEAAPQWVASCEEGEVVVVGEPVLMIWQVQWLWLEQG